MTEDTKADPAWLVLVARLRQLGVWLFPIAFSSLYVAGFLVLNSNLARYGFMDVEFVDGRYFLAGASFVFYLACFYLFLGRAVLFTPTWLKEDVNHLNRNGPRPIWSAVVFVHANLTAAFFACLSAALFTNLAVASSETAYFYIALAGAFFVSYTLDITNLDLRFPRLSEALNIALKSIAVVVFFNSVSIRSTLLTVLLGYGAIFVFINLAIDAFVRRGVTKDRVTFTGIYTLVVLCGAAMSYGTFIYGEVSSKLGGARPRTVYLALKDDPAAGLPLALAQPASSPLSGRLVHQTDKFAYLSVSGYTVRLRSDDIRILTIVPEPDRQFWDEYFSHRQPE
jgi:hypothetical protein